MNYRLPISKLKKIGEQEGWRSKDGVDILLEDSREVIGLRKRARRDEAFVEKTLLGRNDEIKRIVELSIGSIEDMTGISREEMFGTEETGEKVVYIGAPWQGLTVMDSERFFVFDYEYGEIANFSKDFEDMGYKVEELLYGEYNPGIYHYYQNISDNLDSTDYTDFERDWYQKTFRSVLKIRKIVNGIIINPNQEEGLVSELSITIQELETLLEEREQEEPEIIEQRKTERDALEDEFAPYHSIEGMHRLARFMAEKVKGSLEDIRDYREIVLPELKVFENLLPRDINLEEKALRMRQEELDILNELRLKKRAEKSQVIVGMFPRLPLLDESVERFVASYSLSTHIIPEMDTNDFRTWWQEIQRILKTDGKAYIFPMQQGFPFGRTYDEEALIKTLEEYSVENGGHLEWEFYENPNPDAWRQDETLIITKK